MVDYRHSIARLLLNGKHFGSAWLMASNVVCTASHCVKGCTLGAEIELDFPSGKTTGKLIVDDKQLDIALIEISTMTGVKPLVMVARPTSLTGSVRWELHGYPVGLHETGLQNSGLKLAGLVRDAHASIDNAPAMQLFCEEGGKLPAGEKSVFAGVSGCPILLRVRESDESLSVVGVMSQHGHSTDSILYCTPIDAVTTTYAEHFPGMSIKSWDGIRRFPTIINDDKVYRSNLDTTLLDNIWKDGFTGFWCNVRTDESQWLSSAVQRIVVHSPFMQTRPTTTLHVAGKRSWRSGCIKCAEEWIPLTGKTPESFIEKYVFEEVDSTTVPQGGSSFATADELGLYLQKLCNDWTLLQLRDRLAEVFDDHAGLLNYEIAADILDPMKTVWRQWVTALESDPTLNHHFLGLMLSCDGAKEMSDSANGVGPDTLDACIVPTVAFTLAVCAGLPVSIQSPKGQAPGNLGDDAMSGHSCGVQTISRKTLKMAAKTHRWRTSFVMLPHLDLAWETFHGTQSTLNKNVGQVAKSLNEEPAASIVLPSDVELLTAIANGLAELRTLLRDRCELLVSQQEEYVDGAKHVDA
ncbi:ABC-three component system protein [Rhodopirellula bahusiensis]|uniref:Peptidase S1 domain-containing protein n=1 Tax=Rhodopirellula bahusiensis TaxID=2014065 RepID=A0A2G1W2A3_9BACT|nr:ABC-three component system protein [Rhodopirellula bahusiensis]PHQ33152.1 hypothetical protein CEE69_22075 [Rhodopirellula bahusiensis]